MSALVVARCLTSVDCRLLREAKAVTPSCAVCSRRRRSSLCHRRERVLHARRQLRALVLTNNNHRRRRRHRRHRRVPIDDGDFRLAAARARDGGFRRARRRGACLLLRVVGVITKCKTRTSSVERVMREQASEQVRAHLSVTTIALPSFCSSACGRVVSHRSIESTAHET